mmetsp:Transcript_11357/g.21630  ORF Transcript_11357/g.21630 Transcript_11357/m.21630 type:complete len:195 (-) Transcript_11357:180-764(-)|eukprot:CAMPEP_0114228834 /NCGR_PEP_ID=MMETSP0058-20121206/2569_1 /TAXON_ID=36894 /ORGANISM="Pyramimonas parkeae, CCMP726" /LENGTH=194 /DNA_ID=CAMNT_0001339837 /DNA_START=703 /DNA_END=1287 /DNA_ORIENTATION=+
MGSRVPASDWSNYEAMLPRPSHSTTGRQYDCKSNTIPHIRTFLRANAHERTVSLEKQTAHDAHLSVPKKLAAPTGQGAERRKEQMEKIANSRKSGVVKQLPPLSQRVFPRRSAATQAPADGESSKHLEEEDETYSETPIHQREAQAKVFDLPQFLRTERAIITAGRTFTWGGRLKLQLPGYDPLRHKQLTASQY